MGSNLSMMIAIHIPKVIQQFQKQIFRCCCCFILDMVKDMGVSLLQEELERPPAKSKSARLILGRRLCFVNRWPCRLRFSGGRVKSWMVSLQRIDKKYKEEKQFFEKHKQKLYKNEKKFIHFFQDRVLAKKRPLRDAARPKKSF